MRRLLLCALVVAACGDGHKPALHDDAGTTPPPADAAPGSDGARDPVVGCLDSPGADEPPTDRLSCDLVPPGITL